MKTTLSIFLLTLAFAVSAQNNLGGHIGIVHPFITFSDGETTTIADQYEVGFPTGITVITGEKRAFDLELVPFISDGRMTNFLFHPGMLFGMGSDFTFGTRLAFETGSQAYGFTPLLNKAFSLGENGKFFMELVVPVRFGKRIDAETAMEDTFSAVTLGLHTGFAF